MNLAKIFIVNAVAVENDSESTFLYVFNLSGLVFSKASVSVIACIVMHITMLTLHVIGLIVIVRYAGLFVIVLHVYLTKVIKIGTNVLKV